MTIVKGGHRRARGAIDYRARMSDSTSASVLLSLAALEALIDPTVAVVRRAAVEVMSRYRSAQTVWDKDGTTAAVEPASAQNPVTEADLAADRVLRTGLLALRPDAGWLSEETTDDPSRLERRLVWVVDPIDGTLEYVEGVDEFAISVGLVLDGAVVLAVLLNPATDELLTAFRGGGVRVQGRAMEPHAARPLQGAVLLASRTETSRGDFDPFRAAMTIQDVGSTAWKLALVAAGRGDAYFTRKPRHEWDIAAGVLLALESGCRVTDLFGQPHRFNQRSPKVAGVVAAREGVYGGVMALIAAAGTLL